MLSFLAVVRKYYFLRYCTDKLNASRDDLNQDTQGVSGAPRSGSRRVVPSTHTHPAPSHLARTGSNPTVCSAPRHPSSSTPAQQSESTPLLPDEHGTHRTAPRPHPKLDLATPPAAPAFPRPRARAASRASARPFPGFLLPLRR
jgi:hypothetical protein